MVSDLVSEEERSLRLELVLQEGRPGRERPPDDPAAGDGADREGFRGQDGARGTISRSVTPTWIISRSSTTGTATTSGIRSSILTSRILRDVVRSLAPGGFVGHIGGDDFIFNVPLDRLGGCL